MRQLTLLLLIHQTLAGFFNIDECFIDNRSLENMWEHKLIHDLEECSYNMYHPPTQNNSEPLQLRVWIKMIKFKFISKKQEFSTLARTVLTWYDERWTWDPKKYDGIDSIVLPSYQMWIPRIKIFNSSDEYEDYVKHMFNTFCKADNTGTVECSILRVYTAKCGTDLSDWPFDAQNCKLQFAPIADLGIEIQLVTGSKVLSTFNAEYGVEWDIMDYNQTVTPEKHLLVTLRLERHAEVLSAIVIYPAFILSVLTLSTLLMDARRNIRLLVICFSLMCHFEFLSELAEDIPQYSKDPPRLLLYYRGSFIMTGKLIVLSFVLKMICRKVTVCPCWIISFNEFVYTKFVKLIIWPRWETKVEEGASEFVKDWTDFANVVNTSWIVVSLIVYVSLYCMLLPHPIPIVF